MMRSYFFFQSNRKVLLFGEENSEWHFTEAIRNHKQQVVSSSRRYFSTLPEALLQEGATLVFVDQQALDRFTQVCSPTLARVIGLLRPITGQGLVLTLDELEMQLRGKLKSKGTADERFDTILNRVDTALVTDFGPPALVGVNDAADLRALWNEDTNQFLFTALQRIQQGIYLHELSLPEPSDTEPFEKLTVHFARHVVALGLVQYAPNFIGRFPALKGKTVLTGEMDVNRIRAEVPAHRRKQRRAAWKHTDFGSQQIDIALIEHLPVTFQLHARGAIGRVLPLDVIAAR